MSQKQIQEMALWGGLLALGLAAVASSGLSTLNLVQFTLNGVLTGGVYALVALGIVIINKATGIFNFAHGMMMLFGGFVFFQAFDRVPSVGFSAILAVSTCLSALMIFADNIPMQSQIGENRLQRAWRLVSNPQFLMVLAAGAVAGLVVFFLLRQDYGDILGVPYKIFRGALGGYIGSLALGLTVDRFTIRPLLGQPVLAAIMMTLAVSFILQGAVSLIWGTAGRPLPIFVSDAKVTVTQVAIGTNEDGSVKYQTFENRVPGAPLPNYKVDVPGVGEVQLPRNLVWGFGIAVLGFFLFIGFFQFTTTGLAMRAVAENQVLAESVGLQVRTILAIAWAIATTMAMVAAVIQGSGTGQGLSLLVITPLAFRAFPAVLLGGLESVSGAIIGGIIIGVVESLASAMIDTTTGQEFAPFAVLLIVLLIRPDGLFGQRRIDRV